MTGRAEVGGGAGGGSAVSVSGGGKVMKVLDGLVEVAGAPFTQRWNKRSIEFQAEAGRDGCGSRVAEGGGGCGGVEGGTAWQRGTKNHLAWQGSTAIRHTAPRTGIKHPPHTHTRISFSLI